MRKIICLGGKPGAGKGTRLSRFLEGREEYVSLSTGDALRNAIKEQTEYGKIVQKYIDIGKLAPDFIVVNIVLDYIRNTPEEKNIILDGFLRNISQIDACQQCGLHINRYISIDVSDEEVLKRSMYRIVCPKCGATYTSNGFKPPKKAWQCDKCDIALERRKDDDPNTVRRRLEVYHNQTEPVVKELEKRGFDVCRIPGSGEEKSIQEMFNNAILTAK